MTETITARYVAQGFYAGHMDTAPYALTMSHADRGLVERALRHLAETGSEVDRIDSDVALVMADRLAAARDAQRAEEAASGDADLAYLRAVLGGH